MKSLSLSRILVVTASIFLGSCGQPSQTEIQTDLLHILATEERAGSLHARAIWKVGREKLIGKTLDESGFYAEARLDQHLDTDVPNEIMNGDLRAIGYEPFSCSASTSIVLSIHDAEIQESLVLEKWRRNGKLLVEWRLVGPDGVEIAATREWAEGSGDAPLEIALRTSFLAFVQRNVPHQLESGEPLRLPAAAAPTQQPFDELLDGLKDGVVAIRTSNGHGSGFVIASDGYAITAAHVADDGVEAVVLADGTELEASVLCSIPASDIALLKLKGDGFTAVPLRTGDSARVGQDLFAIGAPLDLALSHTVTRGILSGYREIKGRRYLQSDVAISPGSSGGPLMGSDGRVVGMISTKMVGLGVEGVAFAVPIRVALAELGIETLAADSQSSSANP